MVKQTIEIVNGEIGAKIVSRDLSEEYSVKTTHLVVDFERTFQDDVLSVETRLHLAAAALIDRCKLVRFEWILHSQKCRRWLDTAKYTLDAYVENCDDYDQNDFDVRLVHSLRTFRTGHIAEQQTSVMFSNIRNIFLMDAGDDQLDADVSLG